MVYEDFIKEQRSKREHVVREFQNKTSSEETEFTYFPTDEKWRISAEIIKRKPKEGMNDHEIKFTRIGKIVFSIQNNEHNFNLFQSDQEPEGDNLYIYLKDGTSGKTSYGVGRFVKVIKENDSYFVDFNLAFTPVCGHVSTSACPWAQESSPVLIEAGEKAEK